MPIIIGRKDVDAKGLAGPNAELSVAISESNLLCLNQHKPYLAIWVVSENWYEMKDLNEI